MTLDAISVHNPQVVVKDVINYKYKFDKNNWKKNLSVIFLLHKTIKL